MAPVHANGFYESKSVPEVHEFLRVFAMLSTVAPWAKHQLTLLMNREVGEQAYDRGGSSAVSMPSVLI